MIRKTSLLRIVPTACGQAADICTEPILIGPANSHWRRHLVAPRFSPRATRSRSMLGDCASVATLRHDRFSERSYLFTMSDITHPHQASRLDGGCARRSLRTSQSSSGGARRNRTDDLLLAKQALSQLSYGPSRCQGSEASIREERARLITDT